MWKTLNSLVGFKWESSEWNKNTLILFCLRMLIFVLNLTVTSYSVTRLDKNTIHYSVKIRVQNRLDLFCYDPTKTGPLRLDVRLVSLCYDIPLLRTAAAPLAIEYSNRSGDVFPCIYNAGTLSIYVILFSIHTSKTKPAHVPPFLNRSALGNSVLIWACFYWGIRC
jgi:hypothetical protein